MSGGDGSIYMFQYNFYGAVRSVEDSLDDPFSEDFCNWYKAVASCAIFTRRLPHPVRYCSSTVGISANQKRGSPPRAVDAVVARRIEHGTTVVLALQMYHVSFCRISKQKVLYY